MQSEGKAYLILALKSPVWNRWRCVPSKDLVQWNFGGFFQSTYKSVDHRDFASSKVSVSVSTRFAC